LGIALAKCNRPAILQFPECKGGNPAFSRPPHRGEQGLFRLLADLGHDASSIRVGMNTRPSRMRAVVIASLGSPPHRSSPKAPRVGRVHNQHCHAGGASNARILRPSRPMMSPLSYLALQGKSCRWWVSKVCSPACVLDRPLMNLPGLFLRACFPSRLYMAGTTCCILQSF